MGDFAYFFYENRNAYRKFRWILWIAYNNEYISCRDSKVYIKRIAVYEDNGVYSRGRAAFKSGDRDLCRDILAGDKVINDMERTIEARCLSLILKQQPIASDLRNVSTAFKDFRLYANRACSKIRCNTGVGF